MNALKRKIPMLWARQASAGARIQNKQAHPLHGYYKLLLENPITPANPLSPTSSALPPAQPTVTPPSSSASDVSSKARIIFGTRLAGPTERHQTKRKGGRVVAGVWVPPKPVEPDDCCMSGCVNCTWEVFREDLEEWKGAKGKARAALAKLGGGKEDGEVEGNEGGLWEGFGNIPVGIKAFMEMEKRLKERKRA